MIVCIGGAVLDRKYRAREPIVPATSNPVDGFRSFGGVGRNICENLALLGSDTIFVSVVGDDENGRAMLDHLSAAGAQTSQVKISTSRPTAEYVAILEPDNELALGIADMSVFDEITPDVIEPTLGSVRGDDWVIFDCNLPAPTIEWLVQVRQTQGFRIACNTVSTIKARKIMAVLAGLDLLFTNHDEAAAILGKDVSPVEQAAELVRHGVSSVILTQGANGLVAADAEGVRTLPAFEAKPVDVTGAGDALVAGALNALVDGAGLDQAAQQGALLAALTVESSSSVLPGLKPGFLSGVRDRMPGSGKTGLPQ